MDIEEVGLDSKQQVGLMTTLQNLFTPVNPTVKKLLGWCVGEDNEEKWAERAIESLIKRLKKKRGAVEEIERALSNPNTPSKCVTIPRSLDGRIQVAHRKGHPHVIYCKLWRWPDLHSHHELRPMEHCKFPFSARHNEICINPYHYRKVGIPQLPPVVVHRRTSSIASSMSPASSLSSMSPMSMSQLENNRSMVSQNVTLCSLDNSYSKPEFSPEPIMFSDSTSPHMNMLNATFSENMYAQDPQNTTTIAYEELGNWASIAYYELNSRIGEIFHCSHPVITVDGFTDPTNCADRFCLGILSNIHRNSSIENTRRHIGRGVQLHYAGGQVYVECMSEQAIFVQSRNCNYEGRLHPTTVIKVPPGSVLKIFDSTLFSDILKSSVQFGFEAVYELTKMCTVRMSFVKGWGAEYHRHDVTATPCWIEIHLNSPLKWLDNVLTGMGAPYHAISSVS